MRPSRPIAACDLLDSAVMFGIGPMELVLILVVALLVLGPKRMPELARTLGRGLSEFRRASNDLRQSLALDDLQNDLRDGLTGAGTIKKPMPEVDRPAQAGDDLPAGPSGKTTPEPASKAAPSGESAGETAATHPGELPLDADPTVHHEVDPEPEAGAEPEDATRRAAMPADSQLGNVPVGGVDPTRARDKGPETKATTHKPGGRDDRRG